jgi:hypothetical protein
LITLLVLEPVLLATVETGAAFIGLVEVLTVAFLSLECSY